MLTLGFVDSLLLKFFFLAYLPIGKCGVESLQPGKSSGGGRDQHAYSSRGELSPAWGPGGQAGCPRAPASILRDAEKPCFLSSLLPSEPCPRGGTGS